MTEGVVNGAGAASDLVHSHSLFQTSWWLDAVAPGQWHECTVMRGDEMVGRWPYVRRDRMGMRVLGQPALTQTLGPWVRPTPGKYESALSREHELLGELLKALPEHDVFAQNIDPAITNLLPFHWHGCTISPRCTYRLPDISDPDRVWREMADRARTTVRKAEKSLTVRADLPIEDCFRVVVKTWERQGTTAPFGLDLLRRIDAAAAARDQRRVLVAEDAEGNQHAAMLLVWDSRTAYYLIGGSAPEFRASGANALLLWHAIRFAAGVAATFDFEGSAVPGIERFFRSFGARQIPFFHVRMLSRRMRALTAVRDLCLASTGRPRRWFF